jgi:hypothetical protein
MQELDERYGDMWTEICGTLNIIICIIVRADKVVEKEIEIMHELTQKVLSYADFLVRVSDICGELDW